MHEDYYTHCTKSCVQFFFKKTSTVYAEENDFVYRKSPASYTGVLISP